MLVVVDKIVQVSIRFLYDFQSSFFFVFLCFSLVLAFGLGGPRSSGEHALKSHPHIPPKSQEVHVDYLSTRAYGMFNTLLFMVVIRPSNTAKLYSRLSSNFR